MEISSFQFPKVYEELGVDTGKLGCIMMDTQPLRVSDIIAEEDLYYSDTQTYTQGVVSESVPHVTLLYGLMQSGQTWKKQVDEVLEGWSLSEVQVNKITAFEGGAEPYYCLVAELILTPGLVEGNGRLRLLPHIDTFPTYKAHITLAYIKKDASKRDMYIRKLNSRYLLRLIQTRGLNYGK